MREQLGGKAAVSVVVSDKAIGGAAGGDLHGNLRQGGSTEVAGGDTSVWVEFVVVMDFPGYWGFLSIEI